MSASEAPKDDVVKSAATSLSPELMPDAATVTIELSFLMLTFLRGRQGPANVPEEELPGEAPPAAEFLLVPPCGWFFLQLLRLLF
jgi:hypothetical protein